MMCTSANAHSTDSATSSHHNAHIAYKNGFPPKRLSWYMRLTAMLMRVDAPMGYVPRKRLWVGWWIMMDHTSGKMIYRAAVRALKMTKRAKLRKNQM